ncbi:hypothetical protein FLAG1_05076 [Fusarium langsethiae]|uniref:Uncharacterized protein n=1 Tax=Fusarium langsethiae TaxID=179993 RepID=A0A0M9EY78_FUSLA|nr:hypothetical protein FLAG1_05076 [Fusarium langsethiae]GKU04669.1 unnamed protein product [Fusarium langsethiae]GKU19160.1 unnamed protein product [Fusarium langsethiae]
MKRARSLSPLPDYSFIDQNKRQFVSTSVRPRERTRSKSVGRHTGKQRRHIPSLQRSRATHQDDRALLTLSSLAIDDKKQGEAPECRRPDAEDSMEICDPEPSPNTPASSSPVAVKRAPLSSFYKRIQEHYQERVARRKQQDRAIPEDTETPLPMDTS